MRRVFTSSLSVEMGYHWRISRYGAYAKVHQPGCDTYDDKKEISDAINKSTIKYVPW